MQLSYSEYSSHNSENILTQFRNKIEDQMPHPVTFVHQKITRDVLVGDMCCPQSCI